MTTPVFKIASGDEDFRHRFMFFLLPGVFQAIVAFVSLPLTTKVLGPADFALFALALSISTFVMSLSQMGSIFLLATRFRTSSDQERGVLITTLAALVMISSLIFAGILIVVFLFGQRFWEGGSEVTLTMVALLAMEGVGSSMYGLLGAIAVFGFAPGYFAILTVIKSAVAISTVLISLFVLHQGALSLFIGHAVGGVIAFAGSIILLSRFFIPRLDGKVAKESLHLGGWSTGANLALQGRQMVERMVLSSHLGLYELGLFSHAQSYQGYLMYGLRPAQQAAMPMMLDEATAPDRRFDRTARVTVVICLTIISAGLVFAFFGREFIGLMTHGKFSPAAPFAALLFGVLLIQFSGRPQFSSLMSRGRGRYLSICNVVAVAGSVFFLVLMIPAFGLIGAVGALYAQFLLYRLMIGIAPYRTGHLPFQDAWVYFGLFLIGAAVGITEWLHPEIWVRVLIFAGELGIAAYFGWGAITDVVTQAKSLILLKRPSNEARSIVTQAPTIKH